MKSFRLPRRSGPPSDSLKPALARLDEFLAQRLASPLSRAQKDQTRQGVDHLRQALTEVDIPLAEFVADDGLAAYIDALEKRVSPGYMAHLMDIWRQAFRFMCEKKLLALDYARCAVPSYEKDPHDFSKCERGFPEALLGIYPESIVPRHTARSIRSNEAVAPEVRREFRLMIPNIKDRRRDATSVAWWNLVRQLALDLKLKSLKELEDIAGAARFMDYFLRRGYVRSASTVRKARMLYIHLERLGLARNPFNLTSKQGEVTGYVIDFQRLPVTSPKQKFRRVRGKRTTKIDGVDTVCSHTTKEMRAIAEYGNPALKSWRRQPPEKLESVYREALENLIARTVLFYPPRPIEFWSMNYKCWSELDQADSNGDCVIHNNAFEHKRKRRPDRAVPATYVHELEELWQLRRARFASIGDPDLKDSFGPGMLQPGVAMWAHPKTGRRLSRTVIVEMLRRALLRMGLSEGRAKRSTLYWHRKAHTSFARTHSKGQGDKLLAAQEGHSEDVMVGSYDTSELGAQGDHMREHLWEPMGVVPKKERTGDAVRPAAQAPSSAQYFQSADLVQLAAQLLSVGEGKPGEIGATELKRMVHEAALKGNLLHTFPEVAKILGCDLRTIERWAEDERVEKILIDGRRYITKGQVKELSQCMSCDEAGLQLGRSGRQVRNLIDAGEIIAISMGKKRLIPLANLRAYQNGKDARGGKPCKAE